MYQRQMDELKTIARELGAEPVGDCRKRQTWELAIERQAQIMDIPIDAAYNPIFRTTLLGGRNRASFEVIEQALGLVEHQCYPRLHGPIQQPIVNSPGAQLAAKVFPGIPCFQNLVELAVEKISGVDCVQEPIKVTSILDYLDCPSCEAARSLYATCPGLVAFWEVRCIHCDYIKSSTKHPFEDSRPSELPLHMLDYLPIHQSQDDKPIELAAENPPGVEPILTGIALSDRFLACYSPPQPENVCYQADADGQLSLFDFEVESADEPSDFDDFESLDAFRDAIALWDSEHCEPLEVSLDSFCEWAPCPDDWYDPVEVLELPRAIESSITCNFFIPTFGAAGDRTNRSFDEPPTVGAGARLPKPKPPNFPSAVVALGDRSSIRKFARSAILLSGRSPPGGDVTV